jgi:hypothetical protein
VLPGIYAWATVVFGIRFSNLTYRGVLTNGPYRFTRHPAYLSKNLFWWASVMPFLVTTGTTADAMRNCVFLLAVNGIYCWRAHRGSAPPFWMEHRGLVTAPLVRLKARLFRKCGGGTAHTPFRAELSEGLFVNPADVTAPFAVESVQ